MDKTMKKQSSLLLISSCLLQAVLFSGCAGTAHGFGAPAAGTGTPAKTDSFAWSVADNGGDFPAGRMLQGIEVQPKRDRPGKAMCFCRCSSTCGGGSKPVCRSGAA